MPVNSASGALSTSVYLGSMLLLLVLIMGPAKADYDAASMRAAQMTASGVAMQIDGLSPGMDSVIKISSMPGTSVSVVFDGSEVTATVNGASASSQLRWPVAGAVLAGGDYHVALTGGVVDVA